MRTFTADAPAFGTVFVIEAGLFLCAALMALRIMEGRARRTELIAGE
jgi:BCD family chlorophyll transporter-like MFS transporter